MKAYFDTSVFVAAFVQDHPHHHPAFRQVQTARQKRVEGYTSTHALAELYAVLTRLPLSPPVHAAEAWQIIREDLVPYFTIVSLSGDDYRDALQECSRQGHVGGVIYDGLHVQAAAKENCDRIYTFNVRHFRRVSPATAHLVEAPR